MDENKFDSNIEIKYKNNDKFNSAKQLLKKITDQVQDLGDQAKSKSLQVHEQVINYTKENPLKVIGISVIAGALLAKLFKSRK